MMRVVEGDLLESKEQYVCHQCNCVSQRAAHLAYYMFQTFPWSDIYAKRSNGYGNEPPLEEMPGNIIVRGNGRDQRYVIAMLGQFYPGVPKYPLSKRDGTKARQDYFKQCLKKIIEIPGLKELAFPWKIGCGAAGGDWGEYQNMIESIPNDIYVVIYRRLGDK